MGIVPIWGLQMLVAITLSFLLKLNKGLVIIAANISLPPLIPLILFLSHVTGALWMGEHAQWISFSTDITLVMIKNSFFQYVVGAITLAIVAGVTFGGISYGLLKYFKRKRQSSETV
jgi:uncharacterized protein (DUF2062 family)